jgi:5-methyltetrahydrofolate--homocysteine methyltransferase
MVNFNDLRQSVITGDTDRVVSLTRTFLSASASAKEILDEGLIPAIRKVGKLFSRGEYYLPELLLSGESMRAAIDILRPFLSRSDTPQVGKYVIGTVQGDVHNIGKDIVIMMLEGNGWDVTDLGVDVAPADFCVAVERGGYQILGMSALLTSTMPQFAETIKALKAAGLRDRVKIMVGGAPVTQGLADRVGADGYAPDAAQAVIKAELLLTQK